MAEKCATLSGSSIDDIKNLVDAILPHISVAEAHEQRCIVFAHQTSEGFEGIPMLRKDMDTVPEVLEQFIKNDPKQGEGKDEIMKSIRAQADDYKIGKEVVVLTLVNVKGAPVCLRILRMPRPAQAVPTKKTPLKKSGKTELNLERHVIPQVVSLLVGHRS